MFVSQIAFTSKWEGMRLGSKRYNNPLFPFYDQRQFGLGQIVMHCISCCDLYLVYTKLRFNMHVTQQKTLDYPHLIIFAAPKFTFFCSFSYNRIVKKVFPARNLMNSPHSLGNLKLSNCTYLFHSGTVPSPFYNTFVDVQIQQTRVFGTCHFRLEPSTKLNNCLI